MGTPKKAMKLDDGATPQPQAEGQPPLLSQGKPVCRRHNAVMINNGVHGENGDTLYFKCQVADCDQTAKMARQAEPVPAKPTPCPQRTCEGVFLEVDEKLSKHKAQLHMKCPKCGFSMKAAAPMLAEAAKNNAARRRHPEPQAEDFSIR